MSSKLFVSQEDFSSRVVNTMVRYKREYFFARPSKKQFHLDLYAFPQTDKMVHSAIHVDDDELNIGASTLNFFNHQGQVYTPSRSTARRYRYGTPLEFILVFDTFGSQASSSLVYSQGFMDMLNNSYPTVAEAVRMIKASGGKDKVAVGRFFFLAENALGLLTLHFRDLGPILWLAPDGTITSVDKTPTNNYLTQCSKMLSRITADLKDLRHAI